MATAGLLLFLLAGIASGAGGGSLKAGTEVFGVDPARVLEVSYRSSEVRLIAHRWDVNQRFTLIVLTKSRAQPELCSAGPGFEAVLQQLTSLKLAKTFSPGQEEAYFKRQPLPTWAEVVIRDNSALPPFQARITPLAGSSNEALVHFSGVTYMVNFDSQIFQVMAGGCATLGTAATQSK
ncbi:MAG: hypothetical protein ACOZFS_06970 [Thermodesulfobacteriota bacterium]